ncbi:hypothetical protein ACF1DV_26120 [Streptomyces achromogenes]|uniref:hypothetical protein n=1 Tax=Streptomyces achromogenes TaxID=67255 RepID=UPI0036FC2DC3
MSNPRYPEIADSTGLNGLRPEIYLEHNPTLRRAPVGEDDNPIEIAKTLARDFPLVPAQFRYVIEWRFSLPADSIRFPAPGVRVLCGAMTPPWSDVVSRCELDPHSNGVDHAGQGYNRAGEAVGVHYWSAKPVSTP